MNRTPRDYQTALVEETRMAISKGFRRIAIQGDTGVGKSFVIGMFCEGALKKGKRVVVMAHKRSLIRQMRADLLAEGIPSGVVMSGSLSNWTLPVQVCSKQTMVSRKKRGLSLPPADLVIVDEGDRAMSHWYNDLVSVYNCPIIMPTATPCDAQGYGMGEYADYLVIGPKTSELIARKVLKPCRVFAPHGPDLKGIRFGKNGLPGRQVMGRILKSQVVGDVVENWKARGEGRPTICFCQNVRHSLQIQSEFATAGIAAKHIDADTPEDHSALGYETQDSIFEQLKTGEIQVVCNVGMVDVGNNFPFVSCIILAAVDRSIRRFRQRTGRGKRWLDGGPEDCIVLDHSGSSRYLGHPDEDLDWTLDARKRPAFGKFRPKEEQLRFCGNPECCFAFKKSHSCPLCGWMPEEKEKKGQKHKKFKHGMLFEMLPEAPGGTGRLEMIKREREMREWFAALGIAANKGQTFKVAGGIFRVKMGFFVPDYLPHVPFGSGWEKRVCDVCPQFLRKKDH